MPIVKCKLCRERFYAKPSWIKYGHGKYCSQKCQYKSYKTGKIIPCFICGKEVYKALRYIKRAKHYFCSKSCQTVWRNTMVFVGPKHFNWKGGEHTYRNIMRRSNVPKVCKRCGAKDRRILAIHHLDRNRKNNKLSNLIYLCHNCHFLVHNYNEGGKKFLVLIA